MSEDPIAALRDELAAVDREILALAGRRQALVSRIGEAKRELGVGSRDYEQEKVVLERGREIARELGFEPDLAEAVLLDLIRHSLTRQEKDRLAAQGGGDGRSALVIGGAGKMGGWFSRFLASQGFDVEIDDPAAGTGDVWRSESPLGHDLIVVATPMRVAAEVLSELARRPPRGLVFDVGSLKSPLRAGLEALREAGARVTSVHPMFGPDAELLSGRHVVFVDVGDPDATREAEALFASTMATCVRMDLENHDRVIAFVLGLSHALSIAFFTALARSGEAAPRLAEVSSTTFDAQLEVSSAVAGENARMYFEIQSLNPYARRALAALEDAVGAVVRAVESGDEEAFVQLMEEGRGYLGRRMP